MKRIALLIVVLLSGCSIAPTKQELECRRLARNWYHNSEMYKKYLSGWGQYDERYMKEKYNECMRAKE